MISLSFGKIAELYGEPDSQRIPTFKPSGKEESKLVSYPAFRRHLLHWDLGRCQCSFKSGLTGRSDCGENYGLASDIIKMD